MLVTKTRRLIRRNLALSFRALPIPCHQPPVPYSIKEWMGIDLTTAGQNPSLFSLNFLAFMKPTLTDISSIFVDGRSGESIKLDAAYLDAVLFPSPRRKMDPCLWLLLRLNTFWKGFKRKRVCLEKSDSHSTEKKGFERSEKLDFGKQFYNNLEFLLYLMMLNRSSSSFSFAFSSTGRCKLRFFIPCSILPCLLCSTLAQGF